MSRRIEVRVHIDVRDHESIDLAIATGIRSARSHRPATLGEQTGDDLISVQPAAPRRNLVVRVGRAIVRKPLGRLRGYLNAPIQSRLDEVMVSAIDRRRSEIAALSLGAQIVNLREEIAALRAEVAAAGHEQPSSSRDV